MKKRKNNEFEVIYFGEDKIIIEEDKRKKYPFLLFFFKYGRLITLLFASISILTFIGGVALTLSSLPKIITPDIKTPIDDEPVATAVIEFNGNNDIGIIDASYTKETAERIFDNGGYNNSSSSMIVTNIITVGNDKIVYFSNGAAVIIYGDNSKLPIYVPNSNNVSIESKKINIKGDTIKTIKKTTLIDGMIIYEFANNKIMTEFNNEYKLYDKNKGNPIHIIKSGDNKVVYFDNNDAVVIYKNKMPYYIQNMDNVEINNNNIIITGNNIEAITKKILPDGTIVYNFPNKKSLKETANKDNYKLYDTDKIIYDKDGNIKDVIDQNSFDIGMPSKEKIVGKDKVLYFDNGSAVIIYGDNTKLPEYIPNGYDVDTSHDPLKINGDIINTINKKVLNDGTTIYYFENDKALIEKNNNYKLVDKNSIEFDDQGNIKDNKALSIKEFSIKNNSTKKLTYRIVVEETNIYENKQKLLPQYIYQKLSIDGEKQESAFLNSNPWKIGSELDKGLTIDNTTYILYEGEIQPKSINKVKLAFWTDYDTIPNEMQDKWFIGTIKLYSWQ